MTGQKSLKEIRAALCERLGILDKELNAWMDRSFDLPRPKRNARTKASQSPLQDLGEAAAKREKQSHPVRRTRRTGTKARKRGPKGS